MKKIISSLLLFCLAQHAFAQWPGKQAQNNQVLLPNGWKLSPSGTSIPLGDLPLNMQLSSSGRFLAVTNNGQSTQSVQLIDPLSGKKLDERILAKSWYGLAFTKDEKQLYVSGGNDNWILNFGLKDGKFDKSDTIKLGAAWPKGKIGPAGMVVNRANNRLYVVTKEDSSVYVIDPSKKQVLSKIQLPAIAYSCLLSLAKTNFMFRSGAGGRSPSSTQLLRQLISSSPWEIIPMNFCSIERATIFLWQMQMTIPFL